MAITRSQTNFIVTSGGWFPHKTIPKRKVFLISHVRGYLKRHTEGIRIHLVPRTFDRKMKLHRFSKEATIIDIVKDFDATRIKNRLKSRKRRAKRHLLNYRYQYFVTITQGHRENGVNANADYIDRVLSLLTAERISFVCVPEFQKDGSLHWHLFLSEKSWLFDRHTYDPIRKKTIYFSSKINSECGRNEAVPLDDFFSPAYVRSVNYMTKYITKQGHKVVYSRNLRPDFHVAKYLRVAVSDRLFVQNENFLDFVSEKRFSWKKVFYDPFGELKESPKRKIFFLGAEYLDMAVKMGYGIEFCGSAWRFFELDPKKPKILSEYEQLSLWSV